MSFVIVLVVCLSLPTLFKDKYCSLEDDIYNTYKHSEIFINNNMRISFLKIQLYIFLVFIYVNIEHFIQNLVVTHHLVCLSSSLQVMSQ